MPLSHQSLTKEFNPYLTLTSFSLKPLSLVPITTWPYKKFLSISLMGPFMYCKTATTSPQNILFSRCSQMSFVKWTTSENTKSEIPLAQQLLMPVLVLPLPVMLLSGCRTLRVWALRLGLCWDRCSLQRCSSWLIPGGGSVRMRMWEEICCWQPEGLVPMSLDLLHRGDPLKGMAINRYNLVCTYEK